MLNVLSAYALSDPEIGYTQVGGPCGWCVRCCWERHGLLLGCCRAAARRSPACQHARHGLLRACHWLATLSSQGMNFITGLLLTYLPGEAEAYAALSLVMRQRGLREM